MDLKNVVHMYIMEYYSSLKKGNPVVLNNTDKSEGCYVKWNKPEEDKYHMVLDICEI